MIPRLPRPALSYLAAFADVTAVVRWRDGRVAVARDPGGAAEAVWCTATLAGGLARAVHRGEPIEAAARRLGIAVTSHDLVVARATAAAAQIAAGLDVARRAGTLQQLHRAYRHRRQRAAARGERFPSYGEIERRLRAELARHAAGAPMPRDLVAAVLPPTPE